MNHSGDSASNDPPLAPSGPQGGDLVRRHRLSTRLWHWLNALCVIVMLMSGLMIFNAHPRLYWGQYGANSDAAWLEIGPGADGVAFPGWATIPSTYNLADARIWHFAFAWPLTAGFLLYLVWSLLNRHLWHDLRVTLDEARPSHIWQDIRQHARLRFPTGAASLKYNVLQKLAYGTVLFILLPLAILTGMTMSPGLNAVMPWLVELFGGRQTARSLHFIAAFGLVAFFAVHIAMVLLAGPFHEVRAMITGWYRLPRDRGTRP